MPTQKETAIALWQAGVDAVGGYSSVATALKSTPSAPPDQIIAVGKAAGAMARAALDHFGPVPTLVVTKDGHGADLPRAVRLIEAAHPVPDSRSLDAGRALRETVQSLPAGSRLLALISGGASSLAEDLVAGKTLADLAALNQHLLASGLDIEAMNTQRRKLSRIKRGGLLAAFQGAEAQVLAISDVPGDDLAVIGSGIGSAPDAPPFTFQAQIIASNSHARDAAAAMARAQRLLVLACEETLHDDLTALAPRLGARLNAMPPGVMILGGEPTVILPPNPGQGGRNQALALALAGQIAGTTGLTIVVGGTDGSDGPTQAAGAVVDGDTWGDGAAEALQAANSGAYLQDKGALLVTGPTGTNVMDLIIALRA
ncbi:MAG: glycerate 2-kinase [Paracoccaceae bacterium]|jgi:glycerate 2-kinase